MPERRPREIISCEFVDQPVGRQGQEFLEGRAQRHVENSRIASAKRLLSNALARAPPRTFFISSSSVGTKEVGRHDAAVVSLAFR